MANTSHSRELGASAARSCGYALCGLSLLAACSRSVAAAPAQPTSTTSVPTSRTSTQWTKARNVPLDLRSWDAAARSDGRAAAEAVDGLFDELKLKELSSFEAGGQVHEIAISFMVRQESNFPDSRQCVHPRFASSADEPAECSRASTRRDSHRHRHRLRHRPALPARRFVAATASLRLMVPSPCRVRR